MLDVLAVFAGQMRFAGAEEGQQRKATDSGVGLRAGRMLDGWIVRRNAAVVAKYCACLAAGAVNIGVPAAVAALCPCEPIERRCDRGFRPRRGTEWLRGLQSIGRHA